MSTASSPDQPVIVVGGGLAGLTAALHLAERGLDPLLLEADQHFGGRMGGGETVELDHGGQRWRFPAEHGLHGLWGQYHNLRAVLDRHGIAADRVPAQHEDWIHREGGRTRRAEAGSAVRRSPFPAPLHYLGLLGRPDFIAMLSLRDWIGLPRVVGSLYLALAYEPLIEPAPLADRTLAELFAHWPPRLRAFMTALMRNGLAAEPEEVPLGGALAFLRFYTLLRRDSWAFDYFSADAERALIAPLAAAITAHGGELLSRAYVDRLEPAPGGWRVHWQRADGGRYAATTAQVVLALDAPAAKRLLAASPATAGEVAGLAWPCGLANAVVRLWFDSAPASRAESGICSGDFTIDNFFWVHRIQRDCAAWHTATGGALVEAHIYGPPEVLALPDTAVLALAVSDILQAYPELRGHLLHTTVQRNPATHTRFETGADARYPGVESPWPAISMCGDWLRYPHPALFLERACITGIAAADRASQALGGAPCPIIPAQPPEPLAGALERALRGVRQPPEPLAGALQRGLRGVRRMVRRARGLR
jgi:carotenoid phi-ring synthase / carotenoid chi-ring synthase